MTSDHYTKYRQERQNTIEQIGEGTVIYSIVKYDEKRKRNFRYEITDNAILIVKDEKEDYIITKMIARPSRLKAYWENVPKNLVMIAVEHTRAGYYL